MYHPHAPSPPARRPHPQPPRSRPRPSPWTARRPDGPERLGKILARARHALRRGAEAVRRELQPVRPPVPRTPRAPADDVARPDRRDGRGRPACPRQVEPLDARDDDGSGAVPRRALRVRGDPHLPDVRRRGGGHGARASCRAGEPGLGRIQGDRRLSRAHRGRRAVPRAARLARERRVPPAGRRRRRTRHRRGSPERGAGGGCEPAGRGRPRQRHARRRAPVAARDRGRLGARGGARRASLRSRGSHRPQGSRAARARWHRCRPGGDDAGRPRSGLPHVRSRVRAAPSGPLLVQLAARGVRGVPRLRSHHRGGLGQGLSGPGSTARQGGHPPVERREQRVRARHPQEVLQEAGHPDGRALGQAPRGPEEAGHRGRRNVGRRQVPRRARVVPLARVAHLQDARARPARALPRVHAVRSVRCLPPQRDGALVPCRRAEPQGLAQPDRQPRAGGHRGGRSGERARQAGHRGRGLAPALPRAGRARLSYARSPGPDAERRRSPAGGANDGAGCVAHRDAVRARRAHRRAARVRRAGARGRHARAVACRQHGDGRGARRDDRARVRPGPGARAGGRQGRWAHSVRRSTERAGGSGRSAHRPRLETGARAIRAPTPRARVPSRPRGQGEQPSRHRRRLPARRRVRDHGTERLRQVNARGGHPLPRRRARARGHGRGTARAP